MYDRLNLTLVELSVPSSMQSLNELSKSVRLITHALRQSICGNLDYGIIGIYQYEKDKHYEIRGMLAMGSKSV